MDNVIGPSKQKPLGKKLQVPPLLPLLLIDFLVKLFVILVPNHSSFCLSKLFTFDFHPLFVIPHKQLEL